MTIETHLARASLRRRTGAFALDTAIIGSIWIAGVVVILLLAPAVKSGNDGLAEPWATILGVFVLSLPACWFMYQWISNAIGMTIGKKILSLRIRSTVARPGTAFSLDSDERRPGIGDGLVRTIGQTIGVLPLGLGYLWALWDRHNQTWHDKMSSTHVVRILETPRLGLSQVDSVAGSVRDARLDKLRFRTRSWPRSPGGHLAIFISGMVGITVALLLEGVSWSSILIVSPLFGLGAWLFTLALGKFLNYVELRSDYVYLRDPQNRTKIPYEDIEMIATDEPEVLIGGRSGAVMIGYLAKDLLRRPTKRGVELELDDVKTFITELGSRVQAIKGEPQEIEP